MKVLHYKSNFLNYSETFIHRIIDNHKRFNPVGMSINKRMFIENLPVYHKPKTGFSGILNTIYFHLNGCLPFYNKTIYKVKPDIIHAHFGFDGYRMIKPALRNSIPFITSFYGSDVSRLPDEFDWPRRYRKLASTCDAFVAASQLMKAQLIDLGFPEQKIYIIPYGLDLEKFEYKPTRSPNAPFMMIGRMVEKKGFEYALKAVKILADQGIDIQLDIYGDGILYKNLVDLTREWNIENNVSFLGYAPVEKLIKEHYKHRILIAPSVTAKDGDEEGLPNTILEAMACGTPVIATDHAAINEVIIHKKTGLLVPERDGEAIAEAIQMYLDNRVNTATISKNARTIIENSFEIGCVVSKIEELYKKVINKYAK